MKITEIDAIHFWREYNADHPDVAPLINHQIKHIEAAVRARHLTEKTRISAGGASLVLLQLFAKGFLPSKETE